MEVLIHNRSSTHTNSVLYSTAYLIFGIVNRSFELFAEIVEWDQLCEVDGDISCLHLQNSMNTLQKYKYLELACEPGITQVTHS